MVTSSLVDSIPSLVELIDSIHNLPTSPPSLYIDLEGINLSREGSISILQLLNHPKQHVYLIDIHLLGTTAFSTAGTTGETLQTILESPSIPKVIFDVRNDSNALFFLYGIRLQGIQDIQLLELASRPGSLSRKKFIAGLARCIENDAPISAVEKKLWKEQKDKGTLLFAPERGGSYEVFNTRPLPQPIRDYCVQDLSFLPLLRAHYWGRISAEWKGKVEVATKERIAESQTLAYQPRGREKTLGPWQGPVGANKRLGADNFMMRLDLFGGR
ncbi:hypothetical protein FQN55_003310 [Onygenales sp. PD_40]|nr:hypothetical protein FQN55_003310 [Onygenales sp. PD_40]